jgi:hypothetical protein
MLDPQCAVLVKNGNAVCGRYVTGGGQDFARMGSEKMYGIPPEQVVGTAFATKYEYDKDGRSALFKEPAYVA